MMWPLRDNAPKGSEPVVTLLVIAVCMLVYLLQLMYPGGYEKSLEVWGEVPARILAGENVPGTGISAYWTWLTSMFMHGGFMHLLGNMVALWLFGDNVEWLMGRWRFAAFYLACGLIANVVTTWLGYESQLPGIGASGAIAGVMAAYLIFYPRARITSLVWIPPFGLMHLATGDWGIVQRNISAFWYVGSWVVIQLLLGGLFAAGGVHMNLGIYAHGAGALAGAALCWPLVIQARRPSADHPVVTDEISAPLWGDSGDGGGGSGLTLDEEMRRLKLEHGAGSGGREVAGPFRDYVMEELLARGDMAGAQKHCTEMLAIARQRGEGARIEGYEALLDQLALERRTGADAPRRSGGADAGWG